MTESVRLQSSAPRAIGHPNGCVREPGVRRRNVLGLLAVGAATFVRPPGPRPGGRVAHVLRRSATRPAQLSYGAMETGDWTEPYVAYLEHKIMHHGHS